VFWSLLFALNCFCNVLCLVDKSRGEAGLLAGRQLTGCCPSSCCMVTCMRRVSRVQSVTLCNRAFARTLWDCRIRQLGLFATGGHRSRKLLRDGA
jgi:hypothetical protein